mmetsp:Transcript_25233/g.55147  ORF Transcript_25233/g.55147 Transcript_25233/m.55147 type:complete len:87 (-) Transcript_25233:222-482(-)
MWHEQQSPSLSAYNRPVLRALSQHEQSSYVPDRVEVDAATTRCCIVYSLAVVGASPPSRPSRSGNVPDPCSRSLLHCVARMPRSGG